MELWLCRVAFILKKEMSCIAEQLGVVLPLHY